MKKVLSLLLVMTLCCSICACGADMPDTSLAETNASKNTETLQSPTIETAQSPTIETTQSLTKINYTTEDVILAKAVEMAKLTGLRTNRDFLELYTAHDDLITLAQSFSAAGAKSPIEAFGFNFSEVDMKYLIHSITARLSDTALACAGVLTHNTQINLPEPLSDEIAVCLKFSADCYILVTFIPVQESITYVETYAIFPKVATELLNAAYFDVDPIDINRIAHACSVAADVSCSFSSSVVIADAKYYGQLAKNALYRIPIERLQSVSDIPDSIIPYVKHFSHHYIHTPQEVFVYQFTAKAKQLIADEYNVEGIENSQLQEIAIRELFAGIPNRVAEIYGINCVSANAWIQSAAQPILLDGTPEQQILPVLVVFVYSDGSACMVCIYSNENNFLQYTFASVPELPDNWNDSDLAVVGIERMD